MTINKNPILISDLRREEDEKISQLIKDIGAFFAFNDKKFEESRTPGITYITTPAGLILPKDKVEEYRKRLNKIRQEKQEKLKHYKIDMDQYILYNLHIHEAFYTGDLTDTYPAVKAMFPDCTMKEIVKVYENTISNNLTNPINKPCNP